MINHDNVKWIHMYDMWPKFACSDVIIGNDAIIGDISTASELSDVGRDIDGKLHHFRHHIQNLQDLCELFSHDNEHYVEMISRNVHATSEIEGEYYDIKDVRQSVVESLRGDTDRFVSLPYNLNGAVDMILDVHKNYDEKLTKQRICGWHDWMFDARKNYGMTIGDYRKGRVVVASATDVLYVAPDAIRVENEMENFIAWVNSNEYDHMPIAKALIAHTWFECIHPFDDGNGRIGRAIMDMILAGKLNGYPYHCVSREILKNRKAYYGYFRQHNTMQDHMHSEKDMFDMTAWSLWLGNRLNDSIEYSMDRMGVHEDNMKLRVRHNHLIEDFGNIEMLMAKDTRTKLIFDLMRTFHWEGNMTPVKYAGFAECSEDTAREELKHMADCGVLENTGKSYRLIPYGEFRKKSWG